MLMKTASHKNDLCTVPRRPVGPGGPSLPDGPSQPFTPGNPGSPEREKDRQTETDRRTLALTWRPASRHNFQVIFTNNGLKKTQT